MTLIERLEAASEGSRGLDAMIAVAVGWNGWTPEEWDETKRHLMISNDPDACPSGAPAFSISLDAALTLVPEGSEIEMTNLYGVARAAVGLNSTPGPFYGSHECGSLPIALTIACLKAREAQQTAKEE